MRKAIFLFLCLFFLGTTNFAFGATEDKEIVLENVQKTTPRMPLGEVRASFNGDYLTVSVYGYWGEATIFVKDASGTVISENVSVAEFTTKQVAISGLAAGEYTVEIATFRTEYRGVFSIDR